MTNMARKIHIYKDIAQVAIDRGLETSENIHNTIQDFVLEIATTGIENTATAANIKALPKEKVSRAYQFARDINRQVGHAISEMLSAYEHKENIKLLTKD